MRPAVITAAIISLGWLIWRKSTKGDTCCPHCDWEVGDDE